MCVLKNWCKANLTLTCLLYLIAGEQFINPFANCMKVVIFTSEFTIISNFLKKNGCQFCFSLLCILQTRILTYRLQVKNTELLRWFSINISCIVLYLFMTELVTDSSPKYGKFC